MPLFVEFDSDELEHLRRVLVSSHFAPGDVILQEGNANRALHILRSGRIRVTREVHDREVPLCDLVPGQTFGELSIIEDGVASATLRAVSDAEVLSIFMTDLADPDLPGGVRDVQSMSGAERRVVGCRLSVV